MLLFLQIQTICKDFYIIYVAIFGITRHHRKDAVTAGRVGTSAALLSSKSSDCDSADLMWARQEVLS